MVARIARGLGCSMNKTRGANSRQQGGRLSRGLALGLAIAAGSSTAAQAQQLVINNDTTIPAGSVEQWPDGVWVVSGTLTIEAGVVFEIGTDARFLVSGAFGGRLEINATAGDPVTFRAIDNSWTGIQLSGADTELRHVIVEDFAATGIEVADDASVLVIDSFVRNNAQPAGPAVAGIKARAFGASGTPTLRVVRTTIGPLVGLTGANGTDGDLAARTAQSGGDVIGINAVSANELTVLSSTIGPLRGGNGGRGFDGGNGGTGSTGSGGTVISPTGGTGGAGGAGEDGGAGGNGGSATGILMEGTINAGSPTCLIANTIIYDMFNGKGGDAGDGGNGGRGGRGGAGVSFTPVGGNGGRGGRGGNAGDGGQGGDAGISSGVRILATNANPQLVNNTVFNIEATAFRGISGEAGSPGIGGSGGSGGDGIFSDGSGGSNGSGGSGGTSPIDGNDAESTGFDIGSDAGSLASFNNIIDQVEAFFGFFAYGIRTQVPGESVDLISGVSTKVENLGGLTVDPTFHNIPTFISVLPGFAPDPGSDAVDTADASKLPPDVADLDGDGNTSEALPRDIFGKGRVRNGARDFGASEAGPDCPADLAEPFDVLDVFDVIEFLGGFDAQDPSTDLAAPAGTFDVFDVIEYLSLFDQGC